MLKPAYAERFEIGVDAGGARRPHPAVAPLRRTGQPRAQPPGALCRRERLRHQGRHPRLGHRQGPAHLRARRRPRRSATAATCWSPTRPARPTSSPSCSASASRSTRTTAASTRCSARSRSARRWAMPMRAPSASFELLARRMLGTVPDYFDVESFHVTVERRHNAVGELVSVSEAVVKVIVGGERLLTVGEGNGPVNALDLALRKDLGVYQRRDRRPRAGRLQGPYPQWRHRGGHPRADRKRRRHRRRAGSRSASRPTSSTPRSRR